MAHYCPDVFDIYDGKYILGFGFCNACHTCESRYPEIIYVETERMDSSFRWNDGNNGTLLRYGGIRDDSNKRLNYNL